MKINSDNYFSVEANRNFLSVSTVKSIKECESKAHAKLHKGYVESGKHAFDQGHYLHAWNEGVLDEFKQSNPQLYSTRGKTVGQLKAEYRAIEDTIEFIEKDEIFMAMLEGKKEQIFTGEISGMPFKIMVDSLNVEKGYFTDLKFIKSIYETFYDAAKGMRVNFIEKYGYILQMAVYQEILFQNTSKKLRPFIAAVDKEGLSGKVPNKEIIYFDQESLDAELELLIAEKKRILDVWGSAPTALTRCGHCEYCKATKVLTKPTLWSEIGR